MNRVHKTLGLSNQDRLLVIHADDVGFCQSSLAAFTELYQAGLVSCGSVMVPSPWFPAVAAYYRQHPDIDLGVHVTLTCEWEQYRWSPLTTRDPATGLLDEDGYCPSTSNAIWDHADAQAILQEMQAQVNRARRAGIEITHIDDHMAAQAHPRLLPQFLDFILTQKLPTNAQRPAQPSPQDGDWQRTTRQALLQAESRGLLLFDAIHGISHPDPQRQMEESKEFCRNLPPGSLAEIILHPAKDTPELRAIAHDKREIAAPPKLALSEANGNALIMTQVVSLGAKLRTVPDVRARHTGVRNNMSIDEERHNVLWRYSQR